MSRIGPQQAYYNHDVDGIGNTYAILFTQSYNILILSLQPLPLYCKQRIITFRKHGSFLYKDMFSRRITPKSS